MRMLQYEIEVDGDIGYVITSYSEIFDDIDDIKGSECLPLGVTIEQGCLRDLRTSISDMVSSQDFNDKFEEIMLGMHPEWHPYAVRVDTFGITIYYWRHCLGGKDEEASVVLNGRYGLCLCFNVPHKDQKSHSKYTVKLRGECADESWHSVIVTEYHNDACRKLRFFRDEKRYDQGYCRAQVSEYTDM